MSDFKVYMQFDDDEPLELAEIQEDTEFAVKLKSPKKISTENSLQVHDDSHSITFFSKDGKQFKLFIK